MADKPNDNYGSLNVNRNRRPDKNDAHARGSAKIDGVDYWVNAWTKPNPDGSKWQSLSFTKKDPNYRSKRQEQQPTTVSDSDDIPF